MKTLLLLAAAASLLLSCSSAVNQPTVGKLTAASYAGKWHEIGRLPNRFERNLVAATASYTARPDGSLTVRNEGLKSSGKRSSIEGLATQPNPQEPGKLKVRFNPFPAKLFAGDYWILSLNPASTRALVGSPNQNYLWFLSKDQNSQRDDFAEELQTAAALGYEIEAVFWNPQRL